MKGIFCISLDTELIWGRVHLQNVNEFVDRANKDWKTIPKLLALFEKYKISATWAITGHMMLGSCKTKNGLKHPEIIRPTYTDIHQDWFSYEPMTNQQKDPAWYGGQLTKQIQRHKRHEIGCHTFAHYFWGEKGFTAQTAESDLLAWMKLARKNHIAPKSFVFPKNSIGHLNVLEKFNFKIYRGEDHTWFESFPSSFRHIAQIIDFLLPFAPKSVKARHVGKLLNLPGSYYFPSARGIRKYIPSGYRFFKAKRGIDNAIKNGEVFHLWTHPIDFSDQNEKLLHDFEMILAYANKLRDEGKLEILTMGEIAKKNN